MGAVLALVVMSLSGCLGPRPQLSILPDGQDVRLSLSSARNEGEFSIRNSGAEDSVLNWSVRSSSPLVIATPASGSLQVGDVQEIDVTVEQGSLEKGRVLEETLEVRSNGGNARVGVVFEMLVDGLAACGIFPEASGLGRVSARSPAAKREGAYVPGELLVQYRGSGIFPQTADAQNLEAQRVELQRLGLEVASAYGLSVLKEASPLRPALVEVPEGEDALGFSRELERDPRVLYAEPNYYLEPLAEPNDPLLEEQWNLLDFGLPQAWDIETGAAMGANEVVLAVIDSGVDLRHEDLAAKMLPGCDFHDGDNDPNPGSSGSRSAHGTHVAGIAAAVGNNGLGVAGVAYGPGVKILPIKVFDDSGIRGTVDNLLDAMLWAAGLPLEGVGPSQRSARVINMSLGVEPGELGPSTLRSVDETARRVYERGVILFAASGNNGYSDHILSPASSPWVYAVGSVDGDARISSFSNYALSGPSVDFMGPGGSPVLSTYPDDSYVTSIGTSMAAPFVAGAAALLLSQDPGLTPEGLEAKLRSSALFDDSYMTSAAYGGGVVCPDRALGAVTRCGR